MRALLVIGQAFGWTWADLMATPPAVIGAAADLLREQHQEAERRR